MDNIPKCEANYSPLSPVTFLTRCAKCYGNRISIIHEGIRFTWQQTYERCCRLASSIRSLNLAKNDVVSVLAPNIPAMYEMHFAVPMAGGVLNTINTRLDANNIATILLHSEAKVLFVDYEYVPKAKETLELLMGKKCHSSTPLLILIDDINSPTGLQFGELEYEQLVYNGDPTFVPEKIHDEWAPIALNYTSGTTSAPKGVVYSHRGAYLSTLSLILGWKMGTEPVYLWTLPMFHCNGWTFTWGVAARGGTNVCLRNISAYNIYKNISLHHVTHMCCAPIVFNIILEAKPSERIEIKSSVEILTGGAPPPPSLIEKIESLGFHDRSKDVIISGGENISSVELESVLYKHPRVLEAAVVAMPHPRWGESPCAFVVLKKFEGNNKTNDVTEADIIGYCRKNMPPFMVPKLVKFVEDLPKTSTGKIKKFELRDKVKNTVSRL
ncbi:hypothetical protein JHK84_041090 [Glycine max]|nr:hypothetical protein JHK84_041090 [Glycine max]